MSGRMTLWAAMYGTIPPFRPAVGYPGKQRQRSHKKRLDKLAISAIIIPVPAGVAHPVERHLAKVEVASSSLVTRSMQEKALARASAFLLPILGILSGLRNRHPDENGAFLLLKPGGVVPKILIVEPEEEEAAVAVVEEHGAEQNLGVFGQIDGLITLPIQAVQQVALMNTFYFLYVQILPRQRFHIF